MFIFEALLRVASYLNIGGISSVVTKLHALIWTRWFDYR